MKCPDRPRFVRLNPTFSTGVGLGGDETVNYVTGTKRNAAVLVPIKTDGTIEIVSSSNAGHWTLDISGYLTQTAGTTAYRYDVGGTRSAKLNPDRTTTTFTYSTGSGLPLLLRQRTGTASTYLVYGPGGQPIEQINPDGTAMWLHHDQLGSVRLATKTSDGTTRTTRRFNAYGTVANQTTTGGDKQPLLGYAGQYTDPETGFQYLRARYYDPTTGQFLSVDPIVDQTREPYGYTGGNPATFSDPSGLCGPACVSLIPVAAGGGVGLAPILIGGTVLTVGTVVIGQVAVHVINSGKRRTEALKEAAAAAGVKALAMAAEDQLSDAEPPCTDAIEIAQHATQQGHTVPGVDDDDIADYVDEVMKSPGAEATRGRTIFGGTKTKEPS